MVLLLVPFSTEAQITWNMGMNIAPASSGNDHPRITVDAAGNPLVIWGHAQQAMFSRWNGTGFTTPVMLHPMTMTIAEASWMGPDIAAHGDTVYAVMKQMPEPDTASHIYLVRSFDGGQTFSLPIRVDFIADSVSRFPTVTTDDTGNPVVGFMKFNNAFLDARWVVTTSADYGNTFSGDVKASGWSSPGATVCDCCPGAILYDNNYAVMLYRDNNNNIRDTWAGVSANGGAAFTSGMNMDQQNWMLMMCPSSGPDGFIAGDSVYSVFMNGASGINRVYYSSASLITGLTQPVQPVTGTIPGLSTQNFPRMAKSGNAVAITWKQNTGSDQLPLLFTPDIAAGFPASYDTVDLDNITNADVALFNGNIYVVWEDENSGTVKFRSGTYTPVNTAVSSAGAPIHLYARPNPASNEWIVTGPVSGKNCHAAFYDAQGRLLEKPEMQISGPSFEISIGSINKPAGIYFLHITSGDNNEVIRLIKE